MSVTWAWRPPPGRAPAYDRRLPPPRSEPVRAFVRFLLPDGTVRELGHGDFVGRLASAALQLDDERISEAHALVSLRGRSLRLLALRGRFAVEQRPTSDVELTAGLEVEVARGLVLGVVAVELPDQVLGIEGPDLAPQVLSGVSSLHLSPRPRITPRYTGDAAAWLYSAGDVFRVRVPGSSPQVLSPGVEFEVAGRAFRCIAMPLESAGQMPTFVGSGVYRPLRIEARFDTVHLHRPGEEVLTLSGLSARILSELVAFDGPVHWELLAREVWRGDSGSTPLRSKWDTNLARLRRKLRDARVRPDLVRSDRHGHLELVLYDGDHVQDRT